MPRNIRKIAALAAVCSLGAAAIAAPSAMAKTHKVSMNFAGGQKGTALTATITHTPMGPCKMKGTLVIPDTKQVWTCKGGTIKMTGHGTTGAANDAKGTWTITGGTRKFKKVKGKGTFSGQLSTGKFVYKGTIKY
ncbi:hypothetical protein [Capillimicrobium parvum]|uniref:Uncharacterized protein n=1 Tax=Capillimicrobium parvum TaxID=2884022 RepID=A0A9E7BZR5_9ACTN|nr:hypothetical protein [Capillimicrobium parvum]UGS35596.1 hypothetical protein DSM104329_01989 [Capillimicrobium parvum]